VARGRFQGGEAGREGDVEEGPAWERVEVVVGANEEGGEVVPAAGGVVALDILTSIKKRQWILIKWMV